MQEYLGIRKYSAEFAINRQQKRSSDHFGEVLAMLNHDIKKSLIVSFSNNRQHKCNRDQGTVDTVACS